MITKLTETEQEIVQSNNGMLCYLRLLTKGRPATPHSWLYENEPSQVTLDKWLAKLEHLQEQGSFTREVFHFDTSQLKKWGPQGEIAPISDLLELCQEGFGSSPCPKAFTSPEWKQAKRDIIMMFARQGIHSLRPAAYEAVVDDMRARDTLESNSGWPLFTRRSKAEVKQSSITDANSGAWRNYPAIALFRNYNQKTRLVWMFPMSVNLVEGAFVQPLFKAMMQTNMATIKFAPWVGFDAVKRAVNQWIGSYQSGGGCVYASDFSSTDAHFTKFATAEVSEVLQSLFKPQYREDLHASLMHMHSIPLVIGTTRKIVGDHGVASGSNWTNFVETIFDLIFGAYVSRKTSAPPIDSHAWTIEQTTGLGLLYAIGDDIAWRSWKFNDKAAEVLEELAAEVGQIVNKDKVSADKDKVKSLQRLFQRGYLDQKTMMIKAVYPTIRALNSSLHPEKMHDNRKWSKDMFAARQFMILENCVDHPLFEEFVKFVCSGHEYLVPFAKQSRAKLDAIHRKTKLLPGLNPTYNQERRDQSLATFKSIQYAQKL